MISSPKQLRAVTDGDDPWGFGKGDGTLVEVRAGTAAEYFEKQPPATSRRSAAWIAAPVAILGVVGAVYFAGTTWRAVGRTDAAMGTLVLSSHPSGAQVVVDGSPSGTTPLALRLAAGPHVVSVTDVAGVPVPFRTEVVAGGSASRHLTLAPPAPVATSGAIAIDATPASGEVFVDGAKAGAAPLTVSDLAPGVHVVQLKSATGTIERRISVAAGAVTSLVFEAPSAVGVSGWISVSLPFEVQVYEGTTYVGANRGERIMVGAGRHTFDLVNESLGFRSRQTAVVGPGQTARLAIETPLAPLSVNAQPWAEVIIDGRDYGETPLANISLPLGVHEMTLRHPSLGQRLQPVTIRLGAPNRVSLDLRR